MPNAPQRKARAQVQQEVIAKHGGPDPIDEYGVPEISHGLDEVRWRAKTSGVRISVPRHNSWVVTVRVPISLSAGRIGHSLTELPFSFTPLASYRFYM